MFDDIKASPSYTRANKKDKDPEVERIKALLFSDVEEKQESESDIAAQKTIEGLFDLKPKTNTLKDWIARKKENNFLK